MPRDDLQLKSRECDRSLRADREKLWEFSEFRRRIEIDLRRIEMTIENYVHSAERIECDDERIEIVRANYVYSAGRIECDDGEIRFALVSF